MKTKRKMRTKRSAAFILAAAMMICPTGLSGQADAYYADSVSGAVSQPKYGGYKKISYEGATEFTMYVGEKLSLFDEYCEYIKTDYKYNATGLTVMSNDGVISVPDDTFIDLQTWYMSNIGQSVGDFREKQTITALSAGKATIYMGISGTDDIGDGNYWDGIGVKLTINVIDENAVATTTTETTTKALTTSTTETTTTALTTSTTETTTTDFTTTTTETATTDFTTTTTETATTDFTTTTTETAATDLTTTTTETATTDFTTTTTETATTTTTEAKNKIRIVPDDNTMVVGDEEQVKLINVPKDAGVKWVSSNTKVLEVKDGILKAVHAGYAEVYAVCGDETAVCKVDVYTSDILFGDVNLDDKVSPADAVAILQYFGNKDKYNICSAGLSAADIYNRGDGLTPLDALSIQKYDAKLITSLPESYFPVVG